MRGYSSLGSVFVPMRVREVCSAANGRNHIVQRGGYAEPMPNPRGSVFRNDAMVLRRSECTRLFST